MEGRVRGTGVQLGILLMVLSSVWLPSSVGAAGSESGVPEWVERVKLSADFRLRYQGDFKKDSDARNRGRIRFRGGISGRVNPWMSLSAGIATGSDDPRSTNQTLENTFDTPDARLDYAFGTWAPAPWITLLGGRIKSIGSLLFRPSDLLWDSDINPEGASILLAADLDGAELFLNHGTWVLDELSGCKDDPFMMANQVGASIGLGESGKAELGVAYYVFQNVQGTVLAHSSGSNTLEDSVLKYNYNAVNPSLSIGFDLGSPVAHVGLFGDMVMALDPDSANRGFLGGIELGAKKIKGLGDWQVKYMYRRLEKDAWIDAFPDSDAYGGRTGVKGHEAVVSIGVSKNSALEIDYYNMDPIQGEGNTGVLQVDWNLKI